MYQLSKSCPGRNVLTFHGCPVNLFFTSDRRLDNAQKFLMVIQFSSRIKMHSSDGQCLRKECDDIRRLYALWILISVFVHRLE